MSNSAGATSLNCNSSAMFQHVGAIPRGVRECAECGRLFVAAWDDNLCGGCRGH